VALNELGVIGVILAALLLATVLFRQFAPDTLERGIRILLDVIAAGLLIGVMLIIAQLVGLLN
jgi:hypothetical protein